MARPRSSGRKLAWMTASEPGVSSAPATPWSTRAATSASAVGASAHSSDVTAKPAMPQTYTRRRPSRSPSEPPTRMNAASVSV